MLHEAPVFSWYSILVRLFLDPVSMLAVSRFPFFTTCMYIRDSESLLSSEAMCSATAFILLVLLDLQTALKWLNFLQLLHCLP